MLLKKCEVTQMINYGLENRVAIITGANNPWGIGATTALAFAREGAKVVLVYKKVQRPFDPAKTGANGVDRYYAANAGDAAAVESKLQEMGADYLILESDISNEAAVKGIYAAGDCRTKAIRQIVTATGDGAVAAMNACRFVEG